jgi:7-cyano-7-deazaguanine synthase
VPVGFTIPGDQGTKSIYSTVTPGDFEADIVWPGYYTSYELRVAVFIAPVLQVAFILMAIKRAIVLLSGGLDSAVTAAIAREQNYAVYALTFDYGQRHSQEIAAARRVARWLGVAEHVVQHFDLRVFGGSALTSDVAVPKAGRVVPKAGGAVPERDTKSGAGLAADIPVTYVPARNTIFLSVALAFAETRDAHAIFLGVNAVDYSGYPDCRPEFIEAFERLANMATKAGVDGRGFHIRAPLLRMGKADIVREGVRLGVDFSLTHSCYDPPREGVACGLCDSCTLRREGFRSAGIVDPVAYA